MRHISKYVADDGSEHATAEEAQKHDEIYRECKFAETFLRAPVGDRKGYVQQDASCVLTYKIKLLAIAKRAGVYGTDKIDDPAKVHNHGMMGRFIDDSGIRCLYNAWFRLMCIDDKCREWEQPYYAVNPGTGPDVAL